MAKMMGMPVTTFQNKVAQKESYYRFTDQELISLRKIFLKMEEDSKLIKKTL